MTFNKLMLLTLLYLTVICGSLLYLVFSETSSLSTSVAVTPTLDNDVNQCLAQVPDTLIGEAIPSPDGNFIAFSIGGSHGCYVTRIWSCTSQEIVSLGGEGSCGAGDNAGLRTLGWHSDNRLVLEGRLSGPGSSIGAMPSTGIYYYNPDAEHDYLPYRGYGFYWEEVPFFSFPMRASQGWNWDRLSQDEKDWILGIDNLPSEIPQNMTVAEHYLSPHEGFIARRYYRTVDDNYYFTIYDIYKIRTRQIIRLDFTEIERTDSYSGGIPQWTPSDNFLLISLDIPGTFYEHDQFLVFTGDGSELVFSTLSAPLERGIADGSQIDDILLCANDNIVYSIVYDPTYSNASATPVPEDPSGRVIDRYRLTPSTGENVLISDESMC